MIFAKKVRIKPTKEQEHQLWKSVGTARWAYNWTLGKQEENPKNGGKFISNGILRKKLTTLKQAINHVLKVGRNQNHLFIMIMSNSKSKRAKS
ncbi:hypothetical protein IIU_05942 [Bacillus cereus VD133]|uniref:Transposase putative helix-turn-helix domain-containing protein n=1 Tax=Bacillus cereus VD133 TaxID=1053233 RepID=A0A9W5UZS9_BACCE|nr:hypothetical protein IIU_05942 [Bacillus cereus VD133]